MVGNQGKCQECEALVKSAKSERWDGRREPRKKDQLRQRHRGEYGAFYEIHLLDKYLLSLSYVPGTGLKHGTQQTKSLLFMELIF